MVHYFWGYGAPFQAAPPPTNPISPFCPKFSFLLEESSNRGCGRASAIRGYVASGMKMLRYYVSNQFRLSGERPINPEDPSQKFASACFPTTSTPPPVIYSWTTQKIASEGGC